MRPCSRPFNPDASSSPPQLTYLPPPWGECEAKALGFFHVYSVTACRIDCETRYIVENCNCRMVHMPGRRRPLANAGGAPFSVFHAAVSVAGDASYCTPEQYKDCAEPALGRSARTLTPEAPRLLSGSIASLTPPPPSPVAIMPLSLSRERARERHPSNRHRS